MKYKSLTLIITLLLIHCTNDKSSKESNSAFEKAVNNYDNCQTEYEIQYKYRPTIDIKNATQIKGLAKDISDYLRKNCYNTYYGNWNLNNSDINTYIIIDNMTEASLAMINELKIILNFDFDINVKYPECNNMELSECFEGYSNSGSDITLIIGEDYQKNEVK